MAKPHLTHVALWTRHIERSIEFYRKYCGFEVVHERGEPGGRVTWIGEDTRRPRFVLVLIEKPFEHSSPNAFAHFGFSCHSREQVDALAANARLEGILAMEPRDSGKIVGYHCLVNDPDGNPVEFSHGQSIDPGFFARPSSPKSRPRGVRLKPGVKKSTSRPHPRLKKRR